MSNPVHDLKEELLAAAERQRGDAPGQTRRVSRLSGRSRFVVGAAALAVAAGVALLVTAPWRSSPGFLARAQAALTRNDAVLHMKMETTSTWTRPTCAVTYSQAEAWVDETAPNTYRVVLNDLPPHQANADSRARACFSGKASELGGSYNSTQTLLFIPPDTLAESPRQFRFPLNVAADLRDAIKGGRAHDDGKTNLDGRTVERIRLNTVCPPGFAGCSRDLYLYVDPETFYPVQFVSTTSQIEIGGGPAGSTYRQVRVRDVTRYPTFEYLPRTAANLALTDIHAQHPNAAGP